MRRFIFLAVILTGFIFFMGCAGMSQYLSNIDQNQAVIISARIMAREIGCQVAFTKDEQLDQTARNVYESIKNGELSQDAINQLNDLASKHIGNRPTIIPNTLDLMQLAGVTFDADGKAVGLEQVSPHFLAAIESGYLGGFDSCKNALQAGFSESEIIAADRRIRRIIILGQY